MSNTALTPILVTGSGGLIGSQFGLEFASKYTVEPIDISNPNKPVDITKPEQVLSAFSKSKAPVVIHFAAYTNVTGAWEQRDDTSGPAYQVNVTGTQNIVDACKQTGKHLIHISTAYIFDGEKTGLYLEGDTSNPIEWYGKTKQLAEEVVQSSSIAWTIFRIDQPFRSDPFPRADVAHNIAHKLQTNSLPPMFTDHFFGPTYINDFSKVLDWAIRTRPTGVFHASSGEQWTDFDFAKAVQDALKLPGEVRKGSLEAYLKTLNRPYQKNTAMNTQKLQSVLDFELTPIIAALSQLSFD